MKKIFFLFFATLAISAVKAQQSTAAITTSYNNNAGKVTDTVPDEALLTLTEKEFNFGKIPQGKPVVHVFEIVNKAKDSLKISNVQASCGCTTPEWEKDKVVAPSGTAKITVGYNAAAEGPFTKMITVTYNGAQSKQINITGEVWKTPATSAPENKGLTDLKN